VRAYVWPTVPVSDITATYTDCWVETNQNCRDGNCTPSKYEMCDCTGEDTSCSALGPIHAVQNTDGWTQRDFWATPATVV